MRLSIAIIEKFHSLIENNFNVKDTAKASYCAQPAITWAINEIIRHSEVDLFNHHNDKGSRRPRVLELSQDGEKFYKETIKAKKYLIKAERIMLGLD